MLRQIVFVAVVMAVVSASDLSESHQKMKDECVEELGYDQPRKKPEDMTAEDWKHHNCLSKCMNIKDGTISEDGAINVEKFKERTPTSHKDKVEAAAEACKDTSGGDECAKITAKVSCMFENIFPRKTRN